MTVLIGLNGFKGSGKNTAGDYIRNWGEARGLNVAQRAFADLLKLSAARALGLPVATNINDAVVLMDQLKESGFLEITIPSQSYMQTIEGREFLKWYGTEAHRDVFGSDFWVDLILPLEYDWRMVWAEHEGDFPDIAFITDVRFVNEATRVKALGGVVWNIDRALSGDDHVSEQPLPKHLVDLVIPNRDTLEAFETNVRSEMTASFHMRFVEKPDPLAYDDLAAELEAGTGTAFEDEQRLRAAGHEDSQDSAEPKL